MVHAVILAPMPMVITEHYRRCILNGEVAILAVIIWLGQALRSFQMGSMSYWFDEAISPSMARADDVVILTDAFRSDRSPLYYQLLRWWLSLGTEAGETDARLLFASPSLAAIPAGYALVRSFFSQQSNVGLAHALLPAIAQAEPSTVLDLTLW